MSGQIRGASLLVGPPAPAPRHGTITEALAAAAASDVGLTFLDAREAEEELPFALLFERARLMAGSLRRLGVERGDRVALVLPTAPSFMDAFFGTLLAGAVPVPLYPPVRLGRLEEYHERTARMLRASRAKLLLTDGRIRKLLGHATERARPPLGCRAVESLEPAAPVELAAAPDDLALVQFSSGTTVDPKPVALSHRNVMANVAAIDSFLPEGGPVRQAGVSWLPLYHDMGLIGCLLLAVAHPGPLTLIPPELFLARPALWLRAIARKRATVSPAPNFAYGLCLRRVRDEELEGLDLSSWRLALNGAEPIASEVARRFCDRFSKWGFEARSMTPVYGLSEASLAVSFAVRDEPLAASLRDGREVVSVGRPLAGMEIEIRGKDGSVVSEGETGRIFVKGPSVMTGYLARPEATAEALREGWLDTGDLGFVQGGELHVCGRAKDVVILRGANHAPQFFEEALDGVAGLRPGCAVAVGIPGEEGETLAILAETAPETGDVPPGDLEARVRTAVLERTGIEPGSVVLLEAGTLPRTSSGKLRRGEARRALLAGELAPPAPVNALRIASAVIGSQLAYVRAKLG